MNLTINFTLGIEYGTGPINGGRKFAGGFREKLVEKSLSNNSAFPFEDVSKLSSVVKRLEEVSDKL